MGMTYNEDTRSQPFEVSPSMTHFYSRWFSVSVPEPAENLIGAGAIKNTSSCSESISVTYNEDTRSPLFEVSPGMTVFFFGRRPSKYPRV